MGEGMSGLFYEFLANYNTDTGFEPQTWSIVGHWHNHCVIAKFGNGHTIYMAPCVRVYARFCVCWRVSVYV